MGDNMISEPDTNLGRHEIEHSLPNKHTSKMADLCIPTPALRTMSVVEKRLLRRKEPLISEVVEFTADVGRTAVRQGLLSDGELEMIMKHDLNRARVVTFLHGLETKGPCAYEKLCYFLDNLGHAWLCEHLLAELVCEKSNVRFDPIVLKQVELLVRQRLQQRARHLDVRDVNELVSIIATRYRANSITSASQNRAHRVNFDDSFGESLDDILSEIVEQLSVTQLPVKSAPLRVANQAREGDHVITEQTNQIRGLKLAKSRRKKQKADRTDILVQRAKDPGKSSKMDASRESHMTKKKTVTTKDVGKVKVTSFNKDGKGLNGTHKGQGQVQNGGKTKARRHKYISPEEEEVFASFVWDPVPTNISKKFDKKSYKSLPNVKRQESIVDASRQVMLADKSSSSGSHTGTDVDEKAESTIFPEDHENGLPQTEESKMKSDQKSNCRGGVPRRSLRRDQKCRESTNTANESPRETPNEKVKTGAKVCQPDPDLSLSVHDDILRDKDSLDRSINNIHIMKRANCKSDNSMEKGLHKLEEQYWQKRCDIIRRCRSVGYYNFLSEHKRKRCDACAGHPCNGCRDCVVCREKKKTTVSRKQKRTIAPEATKTIEINDAYLPPEDEVFKPAHAQMVRFVNQHAEPNSVTSFDDENCPGACTSSVTRRRRCLACAYANEQEAGVYDAVVSSTGDHHLYFPYLERLSSSSLPSQSSVVVK